jgi:copper chaperone CopZ
MKKLTFLTMVMALAIGFTSCQKDDASNVELKGKKLRTDSDLTYNVLPCVGDVTFTVTAVENSVVIVMIQVDGEWIQIYQDAKAESIFTFDYTFTEAGVYPVRVKFAAGGFELRPSITVTDCDECENELTTVVTTVDGVHTLVVTFTPAISGAIVIQGGLNANAVITFRDSDDLEENTTHPSVVANADVTRWEGNVTACVPVTVTIVFTGPSNIGSWSAQYK